jgi:hypothetical protein
MLAGRVSSKGAEIGDVETSGKKMKQLKDEAASSAVAPELGQADTRESNDTEAADVLPIQASNERVAQLDIPGIRIDTCIDEGRDVSIGSRMPETADSQAGRYGV